MIAPKLVFGQSPYDRCPDVRKRYHVIDAQGFIVLKSDYAHIACSDAWKRSDDGGRFEVRDTRDGSLWGCYAAGEEIL